MVQHWLWQNNGGNIMYQLICDKFGKRIEHDEKVTKIYLDETYYKGGTDFSSDYNCLDESMSLCRYCANQIYELLNFHTDRVDF